MTTHDTPLQRLYLEVATSAAKSIATASNASVCTAVMKLGIFLFRHDKALTDDARVRRGIASYKAGHWAS
jgi:hypothetical protein